MSRKLVSICFWCFWLGTMCAAAQPQRQNHIPDQSLAEFGPEQLAILQPACGDVAVLAGPCLQTFLPGVKSANRLRPDRPIYRLEHTPLPDGLSEMTKFSHRKTALGKKVNKLTPNHIVWLHDNQPNDPLFSQQSHLLNLGLDYGKLLAEVRPYDGSGKIGLIVIDSGIDGGHPDLRINAIDSVSYVGQDPAADSIGHGSHIAGTAAALTNNGLGTAGIVSHTDEDAVEIISLQIFQLLKDNSIGLRVFSTEDLVLQALWGASDLAKNYRLVVVNCSFGQEESSELLEEVINDLPSNVIIVASAGNDGKNAKQYPCAFQRVLCVAALDNNNRLNASNWGGWVSLAAPGMVFSTLPGGGYGKMAGTSMAAGIVSGLAVLLAEEASREHDANQLKQALLAGQYNSLLLGKLRQPAQANLATAQMKLEQLLGAPAQSQSGPKIRALTNSEGSPGVTRGGVAVLWGTGFTSDGETYYPSAPSTQLGNTQVLLNNIPVPMSFAGPGQINVLLPKDTFRLWPGENTLAVVRKNPDGSVSVENGDATIFRAKEEGDVPK